MNDLAPIVLFVYNRPYHTRKTVEALKQNQFAGESLLFVFSDAGADESSKNEVDEVRDYIRTIDGFNRVTIVERESNFGLAGNIVEGISNILDRYGKIIVLEDDIVTSGGFLKYMNEALELYSDRDEVMHVASFLPKSGFRFILPRTFFLRYMSCWGWATWDESWRKLRKDPGSILNQLIEEEKLEDFNLGGVLNYDEQLTGNINGSISTWAIKWFASIYLENGYCLYPQKSLSINIGQDGSGIHYNSDSSAPVEADLAENIPVLLKKKTRENQRGYWYLRKFYRWKDTSFTDHLFKQLYYRLYRIKKKIWRR